MDADSIQRRLRGALGNAVVWAAGWSALGLAGFATLKIAGGLPAGVRWIDAVMVAGRLGFAGGIVGGAFSVFVGLLYRGSRLADIRPARFGVGGAVVAGAFVPAFMTVGRLLSGDALLPLELVLSNGLLAAAFGGVTAGGSLILARRADPRLSGRIERERLARAGEARIGR